MLCTETDFAALWAWQELRRRGAGPVDLVTAGALASAMRWRHELNGEPDLEIALADGRILRRSEIGGVLNRLTYVPLRAAGIAPTERPYAEQEWRAFFSGWLYSLPGPTLNRATAHALSGTMRDRSGWLALAGQAGLPAVSRRFSYPCPPEPQWEDRFSAIVVGRNVLGLPSEDESWKASCARLAEAADCGLLGLDFVRAHDTGWVLSYATPLPDLRAGGLGLINLLVAELAQ